MSSAARPPEPAHLSEAAGNGCIFGTLGVVLLLTVGFAFVKDKTKVKFDKDNYLAARNTQGLLSMTLSYFVSGMGAWVIFAAPQAAVIGGWIALAGYALSTTFPLILFSVVAPMMRKNVPNGFTMNEYLMARLGPVNVVVFTLVMLFYMSLYLTAELASAGSLASGLTKIPIMEQFWGDPNDYTDNVFGGMPLSPILGVSLVTLAYTVVGGLPVSILTDRIQGAGIFLLTLIIAIAAYAMAGDWDKDRFAEAAGHGIHPNYVPTDYGNSVAIAISLIMGVTCANMFHAGYWQRVWAAESNSVVKHATYLASVMSLIVMLLVGITGWVAYAHFGTFLITAGGLDLSFLSAPWLVNTFMGDGWAALVLIFGIAMIASTADTLQSGMTALLWPAADKILAGASDNVKVLFVVVVTMLLNVVPIILALSGQSILQLFLLADLVAACAVAPLFLGFWERTHPAATIVGVLAGGATVCVVYAVASEWDEGFRMLVDVQGGIFNRSAAYAFCLTPVVSALATVLVSLVTWQMFDYKFAGYPTAATATDAGVQMSAISSA